jgi:hypothetical protein
MIRARGRKIALSLAVAALWAQPAGAAETASQASDLWKTLPADHTALARPDLFMSCAGPATTPLCAFKTYLACVLYDAPALCAPVGLDGLPERFPGADTLDEAVLSAPWQLPFERLMPEAFALHLYDAGAVPARRFDGATRSASFSGDAYELVLDLPEPYVKGLVYRLSAFFQPRGAAWHMVGWGSSRKAACDVTAETAAWGPCRWFVRNLAQRDVFAPEIKPVWASPTPPGRSDYPHPGIELMMGLPHQPIGAPFAGTIVRRALKYPDVPLYDWVVVEGEGRQAGMTVKFAMVDRGGPAAGERVAIGTSLGRPQWVEREHPGAGRFVHMELLRGGQQIDPRTVMRERKNQDVAK